MGQSEASTQRPAVAAQQYKTKTGCFSPSADIPQMKRYKELHTPLPPLKTLPKNPEGG